MAKKKKSPSNSIALKSPNTPSAMFPLNPANRPLLVQLSNKGGEVGRLEVVNEEIVFRGKAAESAKIMFDHVIRENSDFIKSLKAENKSLREERDLLIKVVEEDILNRNENKNS